MPRIDGEVVNADAVSLRIHRISGVDDPAQKPALVTIQKCSDPALIEVQKASKKKKNYEETDTNKNDLRQIISSTDNQHSHAIRIDVWQGALDIDVGFADDPTVADPDRRRHYHYMLDSGGDNYVLIEEPSGLPHTHTVSKEAVRASLTRVVKSGAATEQMVEEFYATKVKKGTSTMTDKEKLEVQKRLLKMAGASAYVSTLKTDEEHLAFLKKSEEEQTKIITEFNESQKDESSSSSSSSEETETESSDVAKLREEVKALKATISETDVKKQAESVLKNAPGSADHKVALMKAVNGIEDADVRKGVIEILQASNPSKGYTSTFEVAKSDDGEPLDDDAKMERIEKLASEMVEKNPGLDIYEAKKSVLAEHPELIVD